MINAVSIPALPHVAVLAFPFGNHVAPFLAIVRNLALLSPETHFSFLSTEASNTVPFSSCQIPPNLTRHDVSEPLRAVGGHPLAAMMAFVDNAEEVFRRELELVEKDVGRKLTCLVTDAFHGFAAKLATERGVGWVAFWMAGPSSLAAHLYTNLIRGKLGTQGIEGEDDDLLDYIPGMAKVRVQDLQDGIVSGDLDSPFHKMLLKMARALPQASAVFINTFDALDKTTTADLKSIFPTYLNIGPVCLTMPSPSMEDAHGCLPWLDEHNPNSVAYISFGTAATPPPHELAAIATVLEERRMSFIWSLKDHSRVHLPEGFLTRTSQLGKIVSWAPQLEILAHSSVGVFITHFGWNSFLECVVCGVPMIGRPFFGDHKLNGRLITSVLETGMTVENGVFTKDGLGKCVQAVMEGDEGLQMRERAGRLKKVVREAAEEERSSRRNLTSLLNEVTRVN